MGGVGVKRVRPSWYLRMQRTTKLKNEIAEILREWPTGGACTTLSERDVVSAIHKWAKDLVGMPESLSGCTEHGRCVRRDTSKTP